jgi:hypothetical protein
MSRHLSPPGQDNDGSNRALMEAKSSASANELSIAIVSDLETSEGRTAAQAYVKSRLQGASMYW